MHFGKSALMAKQIMKYNSAAWITRGKSDDGQNKWSITNSAPSGHITGLIRLAAEGGGGVEGGGIAFKILIRRSATKKKRKEIKAFLLYAPLRSAQHLLIAHGSLASSAATRPVRFEKQNGSPSNECVCARRSIRRGRPGCSR